MLVFSFRSKAQIKQIETFFFHTHMTLFAKNMSKQKLKRQPVLAHVL